MRSSDRHSAFVSSYPLLGLATAVIDRLRSGISTPSSCAAGRRRRFDTGSLNAMCVAAGVAAASECTRQAHYMPIACSSACTCISSPVTHISPQPCPALHDTIISCLGSGLGLGLSSPARRTAGGGCDRPAPTPRPHSPPAPRAHTHPQHNLPAPSPRPRRTLNASKSPKAPSVSRSRWEMGSSSDRCTGHAARRAWVGAPGERAQGAAARPRAAVRRRRACRSRGGEWRCARRCISRAWPCTPRTASCCVRGRE